MLDPTFGVGGVVLFNRVGVLDERAEAVIDRGAGGMFVVGHGWTGTLGELFRGILLVRLNVDGTVNPSCGGPSGAFFRPRFPDDPFRSALADLVVTDATFDGSGILVTGYAHFGTMRRHLFVARFLGADCAIDTGFGPDGSGVTFVSVPTSHVWGGAVSTESGGARRIVVAGTIAAFDVTPGVRRGIFAGEMNIFLFGATGAHEIGMTVPIERGEGWHEEATAIARGRTGAFVIGGNSYRVRTAGDVHRMRVARLSLVGAPTVFAAPTVDLPSSSDEFLSDLFVDSAGIVHAVGSARE